MAVFADVPRYNQVWFWYRCQFVKWRDWNIKYTRKGLVKQMLTRGIKYAAIVALLLVLLRARQSGRSLKEQALGIRDSALAMLLSSTNKVKGIMS
jgi:hypothetical protein